MEDEEPDDARHRRSDPVRPEEERPVDGEPADLRVGQRGEEQGERQADESDEEREPEARRRAPEIGGIAEESHEVAPADEDEPIAER